MNINFSSKIEKERGQARIANSHPSREENPNSGLSKEDIEKFKNFLGTLEAPSIAVHGVEYAFGAHDYPTSGILEVDPRQCPGFRFRKSIFMGTTYLDPLQVREFVEIQSLNYNGDAYHLITKNCNHFCQDICYQLTGSVCNFLLPEPLKTTVVRHDPDSQIEDDGEEEVDESLQLPIFNIDMPEAVLCLFSVLTFFSL